MNQEYLWSKKGSDPDVERLEGLLAEFRFDGDSASEQKAKNIIPVARVSKRRFVLGLSFATGAAALVLLAIWVTTGPVVPIANVEKNTGSGEVTAVLKNDNAREGRLTDSASDIVPKAEPTRPQAQPARPKVNRSAKASKAEKGKLTQEEEYAYDRLMVALSIAGSKLRVVQDTIDRKGDAVPQSIRNEK